MPFDKEKVNIFKRLARRGLPYRKRILSGCSNTMIRDIVNIVKEIRKNPYLKISNKQLKKIRKFRKFTHNLISKKKNIESKRRYMVKYMKGGFLSAIAPLLISLASSALPAITNLFK